MDKKRKFNEILRNIKSVKIQGARNIAKAALKAYFLVPSKNSKKLLLASRPTEPMMENVLHMADDYPKKQILDHFDSAQKEIDKNVLKLIKKNSVIFTHCHSTNVLNSLIYAHKKGKKFEVYVTESRPLFQGRKTARNLQRAGIKVTIFIDSAIDIALTKKQGTKKADIIFIGADALIKKGIINKIGSGLIAKIAKQEKIPLYVIADSWKFTKNKVPIEQRALNEIWDSAPKKVKIKNPAFEFVDKKYIKGIISEYGILKYDQFLKKAKNQSFSF